MEAALANPIGVVEVSPCEERAIFKPTITAANDLNPPEL
jgi:hypothetical protein